MAKHRRRRPRHRGRTNIDTILHGWPAWWDVIFHRRPKRRDEKKLTYKVKSGQLDPDAAAWPLGNHKPHWYYW